MTRRMQLASLRQPVRAKENSPLLQRWGRSRRLSRPAGIGRNDGKAGLGRGTHLSSLRDSAGLCGGNPALKRWAIVCRPDGLVSHRFLLKRAVEAFRLNATFADKVVKVMVES